MALPSLVSFGPMAPWPAPSRLDQFLSVLRDVSTARPLSQAIQDLPQLWKAMSTEDPELCNIAGDAAANQLVSWITTGNATQLSTDNILRMPLTIIAHIVQYITFLHQNKDSLSHKTIRSHVGGNGGFQGLCVGLLSALAVASGETEEQMAEFAASSIQLAFIIGAYIDLDSQRNGDQSKSSTIVVRWKAHTNINDIERVLSQYPKAYITVIRDTNDVTITVPTLDTPNLLKDLTQLGATALDVDISGRYHSNVHDGLPLKILKVCKAHYKPSIDGSPLVRSNTDAQFLADNDAALTALKCILGERADWSTTMSKAASSVKYENTRPTILAIGNDAITPSISKTFSVLKGSAILDTKDIITSKSQNYPDDAIAIIGMSCRFPGADSVDEFWELLLEAKSMLSEMPESRFGKSRSARSNKNLRYWGNFLENIEAFDPSFFKRSPREAAQMDPQQRLLLHLAYEALECSGYFADCSAPEDIGCYIGACAVDYDFNMACHPPTAYSATGTLRSFVSGKLSHYFGWSGPSLVIDTACSSSAVAIHTACTALRTGQCSQALAGGITLMTSPYLYENFNAAHFLTPTGGSKPFSADADGYCRGEGGGLLMLKRASDAFRDGDHIDAIITGSGVNQNDNCVAITVPHTSSQGSLYHKVAKQAGITPSEVSFVEAHGTGTPVGDPIEMESIRRVFGGSNRANQLIVSSAKGNIGHLEGASGVAALIKAILQMEHRLAPPQALFKSLNPKIPALEPDNICVPQSTLPLPEGQLTACVNNYGAAGSNAAMMVTKPRVGNSKPQNSNKSPRSCKLPVMITAASSESLLAYCRDLDRYCQQLKSSTVSSGNQDLLSNLAFSLANRLNHKLSFGLTFSTTDIDQLQSQLKQQTSSSNAIKERTNRSPVVLCFGGQVSDKVALNKQVWEESALLRFHLDTCDSTLRDMGFPRIYPGLFQTESVTDVVILHSILFALQYACAQSWIESGLRVDALIGHSFGQLTAMCISGILSLRDSLKLVAGRASLMQKYWGSETGTMIAIETVPEILKELQAEMQTSGSEFEIACYNGPTSHVVVSDKATASNVESKLTERSIRYRRLDVPYGFHSRFTEPLLSHLEELASSLTFQKSRIPLETCTENERWAEATPALTTAHTREPVFFGKAVHRLQASLGTCTWLEVGSDSSITGMVKRALGPSSAPAHTLVPMSLNKSNANDALVDATITLWNAGQRTNFWHFHKSQKHQFDLLRVPRYAWQIQKPWLELDLSTASEPATKPVTAPEPATKIEPPPTLLRLQSSDGDKHQFSINLSSEEYQAIIAGLEASNLPACPSALFVELASRAIRLVGKAPKDSLLSVQNFQVHSPLGLESTTDIVLDLQSFEHYWGFSVSGASESTCHAEGIVSLRPADSNLKEEFSRYERLIGKTDKVASIVEDPNSESLRGNVLYKMLARASLYPDWYHGVKIAAALDSKLVAKVINPPGVPMIVSKESTIQLPALESFIQALSLHANCLNESRENEIFRFTGADRLQWSPMFEDVSNSFNTETSWDVLAFVTTEPGSLSYDVFIQNTKTASLELFILGAQFVKSGQTSMIVGSKAMEVPAPNGVKRETTIPREEPAVVSRPTPKRSPTRAEKPKNDPKSLIFDDICGILNQLADIPKNQVKGNKSFDDLDVDSLMVIEIISELSTLVDMELPLDELQELTDINSLVDYLSKKGCRGSSGDAQNDEDSASSSRDSSSDRSSSQESPATTASSTPPEIATPKGSACNTPARVPSSTDLSSKPGSGPFDLGPRGMHEAFASIRFDFEKYAKQTGAEGFWSNVYPDQERLVCSYVIDAYRNLGCDLASIKAGEPIPPINALPKHSHLVAQMSNMLADSGILDMSNNKSYIRTAKVVDSTPPNIVYDEMMRKHPQYASETKLLAVAGPRLVACLSGKQDPIHLLFGDKRNRELLADFYANSQMLKAITRQLGEFVSAAASKAESGDTIRILEVGAGTGGTTKYLVEHLTRCNIPFEYTFTDISQALVTQAKKAFSKYPQMSFTTYNCDQPPPHDLRDKFHLVISTNCIHATSNLTTSTTNILPTLREDGALCLVEFTRNLYWFDLVFGLLEGWWLFSDGRQHALASEQTWDRSLRAAGYSTVSWTDGDTEEAKTLRLISAYKSRACKDDNSALTKATVVKRAGIPMQEVVWKQVGSVDLSADVYFPKKPDPADKKRPIALLIHGGGHFLFGRKDVPMKHIRILLERGFLPVSTDYRLCPETNLFEGPMTDCCDALKWATETLPSMQLAGPSVTPDANKVIAIGWSSGGQLAMSMGYTAPEKGIKPPDAVFALYSPSDMGCDHWHKPCYPLAAEEPPAPVTDLLAGVRDDAIIEYAPISEKRTMALSLTLKDDRAKIILHMCWESQTIQILTNGLPHPSTISSSTDPKTWAYPPMPTPEQIAAISPLHHIENGTYKVPTFMVHGDNDDWLPLEMNERAAAAMRKQGVPVGLAVPKGCTHAFDLFPVGDPKKTGWAALEQGYDWICERLGMR